MTDQVKEILSKVSQSDDVAHEFDSSVLQRYQDLLLEFRRRTGGQRFGQFQAGLKVIEAVLVAMGALLGYILALQIFDFTTNLMIWSFYLVLLFMVVLTIRLIPDEIRLLNEKATRIRLVNLCERLAGQLALFDLIYDEESRNSDEHKIINQLSEHIPEYETLSEEDKRTIQNCLDSDVIFDDSRETNISLDNLDINDKTAERLNRATKEIVDLCPYIFAGGSFTAKLYLRTKMEIDDLSNIDLDPVCHTEYNSSILGAADIGNYTDEQAQYHGLQAVDTRRKFDCSTSLYASCTRETGS